MKAYVLRSSKRKRRGVCAFRGGESQVLRRRQRWPAFRTRHVACLALEHPECGTAIAAEHAYTNAHMTHHEFLIASVSSAAPDELRFPSRDYLELKTTLVRLFRNPNYRPPVFPKDAMDLYQACCQSNLSGHEVANAVRRDPLLVGQVFSAAQSAAFGGVPAPRSLREAVTRLGNRRVAEIALRASLDARVFRSKAYAESMERLRMHSVFTAELMNLIESSSGTKGSDTYLSGLLHDVGIAGILLAMEDANITPPIDRAWPSIWALHESSSLYLARLWGLSEELANCIGLHHNLVLDGEDSQGTLSLALADGLAHDVGRGIHRGFSCEKVAAAAAAIGIRSSALSELRDKARALAETC
jgi:HD-like signal output (HDOD) protein